MIYVHAVQHVPKQLAAIRAYIALYNCIHYVIAHECRSFPQHWNSVVDAIRAETVRGLSMLFYRTASRPSEGSGDGFLADFGGRFGVFGDYAEPSDLSAQTSRSCVVVPPGSGTRAYAGRGKSCCARKLHCFLFLAISEIFGWVLGGYVGVGKNTTSSNEDGAFQDQCTIHWSNNFCCG